MNRKGWENLSPNYRRRLERRGITRESYNRGDSLIRARGHFVSPSTPSRKLIYERQRAESEAWLKLRGRIRRLQAGESIRKAYLVDHSIKSVQVVEDTVRHYESMEAQYVEGEADLVTQHWVWYDDMHELYGDMFDYPDLDIYYHGNTSN